MLTSKAIIVLIVAVALAFLITKSVFWALVVVAVECLWVGTLVYLRRHREA